MPVVFEEKPLDVKVTLDFSTVSWGDALVFQKAYQEATPDERLGLIDDLVARVSGKSLKDYPSPYATEIANRVIEGVSGDGPEQKN